MDDVEGRKEEMQEWWGDCLEKCKHGVIWRWDAPAFPMFLNFISTKLISFSTPADSFKKLATKLLCSTSKIDKVCKEHFKSRIIPSWTAFGLLAIAPRDGVLHFSHPYVTRMTPALHVGVFILLTSRAPLSSKHVLILQSPASNSTFSSEEESFLQ